MERTIGKIEWWFTFKVGNPYLNLGKHCLSE